MKTEHADSKEPGHVPHPPRGASPLRLIILLSILAVVGGALLYDWVIAPPRVKAANDKLLSEVVQYNETGLLPSKKVEDKSNAATPKSSGMLYSEDIQKILGMAPTKVQSTELYTIEHYCWWGWVPRNRNYITVLYLGDPKKPHYSTHYANMMPEDSVIPGKHVEAPPVDLTSETSSAAVAMPMPPMGGPAMGPPGMAPGGGKGKGRPGGTSDASGDNSKAAAKAASPQKGEEAKEPATKSP